MRADQQMLLKSIERTAGKYLSNEDFIAVAREFSFVLQWCSHVSPNVYLNISEKSLRGLKP